MTTGGKADEPVNAPAPLVWGSAVALGVVSIFLYLFVGSFEDGYNQYFGIPGDFIQANALQTYRFRSHSSIMGNRFHARTAISLSGC